MPSLKGTGTNDKKKVAIAAALGFVVLALAYHTLFSGPSDTVPPPVPGAVSVAPSSVPARSVAGARAAAASSLDVSLDPALHPELMAENENYLYTGSGRDIFSQNAGPAATAAPVVIPKLKAPPRPVTIAATPVNTGPPPPPAIDLRFFGYAARSNGNRRAFLLHGDDVFVASEGDVVSHRYRVVHIAPSSIEVEDLPFHHTQTLPLTQGSLVQ